MKQIADALELLTAQHEEISVALAQLPTGDVRALPRALGELADQVATHLAIEEQFMATLGLTTASAEHDEVRGELAELLVMELSSPELSARIEDFAARWTRHSSGQEQTFVALAETLSADVLAGIGVQLGELSERSRCLAA
ncbi:MAG TPA: hemerythrin domain-containing protein [Kofleriaceae bacterium]